MARVIIADDHPLILKGLAEELISLGHEVVAQAHDGSSALMIIQRHLPDLALMDVEMPYMSGFEVAKFCQDHQVIVPIILLSYHKEIQFVAQAKRYSVRGYLIKESSLLELKDCIDTILSGGTYFSRSLGASDEADQLNGVINQITLSEKRILRYIERGLNSVEIAQELNISPRTVEKHRSNIIKKIELDGNTTLKEWSRKMIQFLR